MTATQSLRPRLVALLIAVSAGFPLIRTTDLFSASTVRDTNYAEGSLSLPLVFGSIFLLAAWLAWQSRHAVWGHVRALNPFLVLTLIWCFCSVLWSPYPVTTLKRSVQLAGLIMVGLALAPPTGSAQLLARTLRVTLTGLLLVSAMVSVAIPQIGVDYLLGGAWRGIFWQKNVLGMVAGFCLLLWVNELRARRQHVYLNIAGIVFSLFMLVMAKSTTALIIYMAGLAIYLFLVRRYLENRHVPLCVGLCLAAVGVIALQAFYTVVGRLPHWDEVLGPITGLFNKSADLTGRTELWQLVMLEVAKHPWQGLGYGAFWLGVGGPAQYVIDTVHYIPMQAHNGYLDILNEMGLIGVAITGAMLLMHAFQLFKWMRVDREQASLHMAFFVLILIGNLSETLLFRSVQFQYVWLVYSSVLASSSLRLHARSNVPMPGAAFA